MGEFEEVVKIVGRVKEVRYVFFSCVLPYHEAIVSESDMGYYFVFVWRFLIKCSSIWWRRMSQISGDGIAPMDAPMVWWYSLPLNEK